MFFPSWCAHIVSYDIETSYLGAIKDKWMGSLQTHRQERNGLRHRDGVFMIIQFVGMIIAVISFMGLGATVQTNEGEVDLSGKQNAFVDMASDLNKELDAMEGDAVSSLEAQASSPREYFARKEHIDETALLEGLDKAADWGSSRESDRLMDAIFEGVEQCRTECSINIEISKHGPGSDARQLLKEGIKSEFNATRRTLGLLASLHPPIPNPSIDGYKKYVNTKGFTAVITLSIMILCAAKVRKKNPRSEGFEKDEMPNVTLSGPAVDDCGKRKTEKCIPLAAVDSVRGSTQVRVGSEITPDKTLTSRVLRTNRGRRKSAKSTTLVSRTTVAPRMGRRRARNHISRNSTIQSTSLFRDVIECRQI